MCVFAFGLCIQGLIVFRLSGEHHPEQRPINIGSRRPPSQPGNSDGYVLFRCCAFVGNRWNCWKFQNPNSQLPWFQTFSNMFLIPDSSQFTFCVTKKVLFQPRTVEACHFPFPPNLPGAPADGSSAKRRAESWISWIQKIHENPHGF